MILCLAVNNENSESKAVVVRSILIYEWRVIEYFVNEAFFAFRDLAQKFLFVDGDILGTSLKCILQAPPFQAKHLNLEESHSARLKFSV